MLWWWVASVVSVLGASSAPKYHTVATFPVKHAAFISVERYYTGSPYSLFVTTFGAYGPEPVYYVPHLSTIHNGSTVTPIEFTTGSTWPNEAATVPSGILPKDGLVLVAGGFLVPGHTTGNIRLYDPAGSPPPNPKSYQVSQDKKGWFYHHIEWFDVDGDGRKDILTARATQKGDSELLWYQQPASDPLGQVPWTEHSITPGPDVAFILADVDGDKWPEVIAAQFFSKRLVMYWCQEGTWSTCSPTSPPHSLVIDDTVGHLFSVQWVDLNGDGLPELLATNNMADGTGSVFAFVPPTTNPKGGSWTRHTLSTGYKPTDPWLPGRGSPGQAIAFHPFTAPSSRNKKPLILLSGDDQGGIFLLAPRNDTNPLDWTYDSTTVSQSTGTVGSVAVGDINHNGRLEFFTAAYKDGEVRVYEFDL